MASGDLMSRMSSASSGRTLCNLHRHRICGHRGGPCRGAGDCQFHPGKGHLAASKVDTVSFQREVVLASVVVGSSSSTERTSKEPRDPGCSGRLISR